MAYPRNNPIKDNLLHYEIRKEETSMELLEKILDNNNLYRAYQQVYKNKGTNGVDGITVEELGGYLYQHKEEIKQQIRELKYKPSPVRRVEIPKESGKMRKLGIPTVVDRVIQQAIVQVITPLFEPQFSETSYGFRPRRSCEMAVIKALEYFNDGYDWIVDIDLQAFFDNVNQDKLIGIIRKTIKDGRVVSLIRKYLVSGVMINGVVQPTKVGTPQGGNLSPLLSNIMLNELDKELEKRGLRFVRYADDCLIMVKSEKAANRVMQTVTRYIEKKLGLIVNTSKSKVARPRDIKYLGFGFYNKKGLWRPKPHIISVQKFKAKLKNITSRSNAMSIAEKIDKLNSVIRGWINYYRIADMKTLMQGIGEHLRHRVRMCIWKYWKRPRTKYKALRKLGISEQNAYMVANTRRGYYWVASTVVLHIAISNERLKQKGLVFPLDYYQKVHTVI